MLGLQCQKDGLWQMACPTRERAGDFFSTLLGSAFHARRRGDLPLAREHLLEMVRISRLLGRQVGENVGLSEPAHIDRLAGDFPAALAGYRHIIVAGKDQGNRGAVAHQLECFAYIANARAQPERATRLLGAAQTLRTELRSQMMDHDRAEFDSQVAALRAALDPASLDQAWAAGRALEMDAAIAYAVGE